jgi:hypothetical protein
MQPGASVGVGLLAVGADKGQLTLAGAPVQHILSDRGFHGSHVARSSAWTLGEFRGGHHL